MSKKKVEPVGHIVSPYGWLQFKFNAYVTDTIFGKGAYDRLYDFGDHGQSIMPSSATGFKPAPAFEEIPELICMTVKPAVRLPQHRAMDVGPHHKALSSAITSVCVASYNGKAYKQRKCMELQLGPRKYVVCMWPDSLAAAPLAQLSHRLYILCKQSECDLSPLFALADPLEYPHYASLVARAIYTLAPNAKNVEADRWLPIKEYIDIKGTIFTTEGYEQSFGKIALDILSNSNKLKLLFHLFFDRSKETRKAGFAAGLWTLDPDSMPGDLWPQIEDALKRKDAYQLLDLIKLLTDEQPEKGQFTVAASAAFAYVAHMTHAPILLGQNIFRFTL